jgi:hypothetical protein
MSVSVEVSVIPVCNFCEIDSNTIISLPAIVDARCRHGGWAYMCTAHWGEHTDGQLGTGHGQRLILRDSR